MKRVRPAAIPAVSLFTGDSSDSDESPNQRRRLPSPSGTQKVESDEECVSSPATCKQTETKGIGEEDTLEAFMNDLSGPQPSRLAQNRQIPTRPAHSDSSEDGFVVLGETMPSQVDDEREDSEDDCAEAQRDVGSARDLFLEPIDHSRKQYPKLVPCPYEPLPHLAGATREEQSKKLESMAASVIGDEDVVPIDSFQDLALVLRKALLGSVLSAFEKPTAIQRVSIPVAMCGRDIIAVAKTGSGKTAAYTIPLLTHISLQARGSSTSGKGPSALIIAPTRELALQITGVVKLFGEGTKTGVLCVVGGHAKYEQFKRLRDSGAEVIVCTPGRLIDMVKMKACGFSRCSFVVLDEADRMFDMGFGPQVDALLSQIRPDAQKLLFSATFPSSVAKLAGFYLRDPVRITVGSAEQKRDDVRAKHSEKHATGRMATTVPMVAENVTETYVLVENEAERESWLLSRLDDLIQQGLVMVFCQSRGASAALANVIRKTGKPAACVHGETDNADRQGLLDMFRSGELPLLITTDLTARGLDISNVKNVVNYGSAKSWEWHVHRVGRTGRADQKGNAYTILCRKMGMDISFARDAVSAFRKSRMRVPAVLMELDVAARRKTHEGGVFQKRFRGKNRNRPNR